MKRKDLNRVSELSFQLNELQAYLGRAVSKCHSRPEVEAARHIAANVASLLNEWHFDLLHIPPSQRGIYRSPNPFIGTHRGHH